MVGLRTAILAVLLLALGCAPPPQTVKVYEKDGVQFSHFSDWSVTKDAPIDENPAIRTIDLEGPDSALVKLLCLPVASDQTLERFAASVAELRGKAVEDRLSLGPIRPAEVSRGTSEAIRGRVGGQDRDGIRQNFNIRLLGEDVPHEATFFAVANGRYKVIVMTQVATENAQSTHPAFELTLDSLRLKGSG